MSQVEPCKSSGCIYYARIKGYCPGHWEQVESYGQVDPERPVAPREGHISKDGYRVFTDPAHPNANPQGRILEHRLAMADRIGRKLEIDEPVLRKNGSPHDNRKSNLEVRKPLSLTDYIDWAFQVLFEFAPHLLYEATLDEEQKVLDEVNEELVLGMNRLRGRLLGLIETFRLDPEYEQALKSTLKTYTYDLQASLSEKLAL